MKLNIARRSRPVVGALIGCTLVATTALGAVPANAAETHLLTAEQEATIRTTMESVDITTSTQDHLIAKLNAGRALESQREGAEPVTTNESVTRDGVLRTVDTYADGSKQWTEQDLPENPATRLNVRKESCVKSGSWYTGCKIGVYDLVSNAGFFVDYTTNRVRDVRGKWCSISIGTCSTSASVKRATASSAGPAWAELSFKASVVLIGNVANGSFGLRVSGNTASVYG